MKLGRFLPLLLLIALPESDLRAQSAQTAQPSQPRNEFDAGCKGPESIAVLTQADREYPYAIEFGRLLASKGIHTECLCGSKMQGFFRGKVGAAWYRTDAGIFDALFLPKGQTFNLELIETLKDGRYLYSFRGTPSGGPPMDSSKPMRVIQHENVLMVVWGDLALAERLKKAFAP